LLLFEKYKEFGLNILQYINNSLMCNLPLLESFNRTGKTSNRGHFQKLKNSYDREPYDFTNYANQNGSNHKKK